MGCRNSAVRARRFFLLVRCVWAFLVKGRKRKRGCARLVHPYAERHLAHLKPGARQVCRSLRHPGANGRLCIESGCRGK